MIYAGVVEKGVKQKPATKVVGTPQRKYFVCQHDPILIVDALFEKLNPDELRIVLSELAHRTSMNY